MALHHPFVASPRFQDNNAHTLVTSNGGYRKREPSHHSSIETVVDGTHSEHGYTRTHSMSIRVKKPMIRIATQPTALTGRGSCPTPLRIRRASMRVSVCRRAMWPMPPPPLPPSLSLPLLAVPMGTASTAMGSAAGGVFDRPISVLRRSYSAASICPLKNIVFSCISAPSMPSAIATGATGGTHLTTLRTCTTARTDMRSRAYR